MNMLGNNTAQNIIFWYYKIKINCFVNRYKISSYFFEQPLHVSHNQILFLNLGLLLSIIQSNLLPRRSERTWYVVIDLPLLINFLVLLIPGISNPIWIRRYQVPWPKKQSIFKYDHLRKVWILSPLCLDVLICFSMEFFYYSRYYVTVGIII